MLSPMDFEQNNYHAMTCQRTEITDFVGGYTIADGILTCICSYTKKGSGWTVSYIPSTVMKPNYTSSNPYSIKRTGRPDINIFNGGDGNLTIQETTGTDQTEKTYINFSCPIG